MPNNYNIRCNYNTLFQISNDYLMLINCCYILLSWHACRNCVYAVGFYLSVHSISIVFEFYILLYFYD